MPALIRALKDGHAEIRSKAAVALSVSWDEARDAVPALEEAAGDSDDRVCLAALEALDMVQRRPGDRAK